MKAKEIRLNRYLAMCGLGSRRKCEDLIASGAIKVNGKVITEMGVRINPNQDKIQYYDQNIYLEDKNIYILLNKPARIVTTLKDEKNRKTVIDLVDIEERIFPVGRLDFNTTGALLLTNDGKLAYYLAHPRFEVNKIYRALLNKRIRPVDLHNFRNGIDLDGSKTAPCRIEEIRIINNCSYLEIELHEGRNRQIRRMFDILDYHVTELHRIEFAGLKVDNLKKGEWRQLSRNEVYQLKKLIDKSRKDIDKERIE